MSNIDIFKIIRRDSFEEFLDALEAVGMDVTDDKRRTMLHEAVGSKKQEHVKQLISRGADVNAQDEDGMTPLHFAAIHSQLEIARILVDNNASQVVSDKQGNTPLWYAAFNARGNYDVVKLCVGAGAKVSHRNNSGKSAVDFAKQIRDKNLLEVLGA